MVVVTCQFCQKFCNEDIKISSNNVKSADLLDESSSSNPDLDKKIDEMELSVRSYNCLQSENINLIGDLVQRTENEMLKLPNFGRKSLNELKDNLEVLGLTFGMEIDNWPPANVKDASKKKK